MNPMEILLSEDEELSAELLERILHPILTRFDVVKTLEATLTFAESHTYDLILFDLRLLDSDIDNSIRAIQHIKMVSPAPLLVVSGMPDPTLKQRCMDAGADGFLPKREAYSQTSKTLYMIVYACTIHNPRKSTGFMDKVRILEQLAAA